MHNESDLLGDDWALDRALSLRLPHTWPVFFSKFGRLTAVQRAVIGPILDGSDMLVCAATAAGKTESACAPLLERYRRRGDGWTILYISPTRALVNDLYERLLGPVQLLGLSISRRTGDYHDDLDPPPNVLITTPESFDSLLCRGKKEELSHVLAPVVAVVLDEVHLFHASARGEQLRWLLERLRRLKTYAAGQGWCSTTSIQIVGLSATLPAPEEVLASYFGPAARLAVIPGKRDIELVGGDQIGPVEERLVDYVTHLRTPEKILVFSNARKRVDELAASLAPSLGRLGYTVGGHHGSLAQPVREGAERTIKQKSRVILFSTSTLEIGVDIGDIDLVVLDGAPPDVSAFLQRIGRGNRKSGRTRVMLCAKSEGEAVVQRAMLGAAVDSHLGASEKGPQFAVARQQVASYIFQAHRRERSPESVRDLIEACLPGGIGGPLLDHLIGTEDLLQDKSGIRLGQVLLDATEVGEIHSIIEGQPGHTVTDTSTGDAIALNIRYDGGRRMSVGGKSMDVTRVAERHLEITTNTRVGAEPARWSYGRTLFVKGASQPQAVRRHLGLEAHHWPVVRTQDGAIIFHFGGTRRKAILELLAKRSGLTRKEFVANDYLFRIDQYLGTKPRWMTDVGAGVLQAMLPEYLDTLEHSLARPKANKKLPIELRITEVSEWLDVASQLSSLNESEWSSAYDESTANQLRALIAM